MTGRAPGAPSGPGPAEPLLAALADDADVAWGVCVQDAVDGSVLAEVHATRTRRTASIGKLLLLAELARGFSDGDLSPAEPMSRTAVAAVADSGLWQHLQCDTLPLHDVAALIGAVSDNLATNVALSRVGLEAVARLSERLGLAGMRLHDVVRDQRGPADPPTLSTARAVDLSAFFVALHRGDVAGPAASAQLLRWLAAGTDLSMAAGAFGLDPLAHGTSDRGVQLWNKTGTDTGVRADTGLVAGHGRVLAFAFLAEWDGDDSRRDGVLARLHELGQLLRRLLEQDAAAGQLPRSR